MVSRRQRARFAFTLIELMVVIAIIAVLAAFLFPVFASAKRAAKGSTCLANLRQIYLGYELYGENSNGICPNGYDDETARAFPPGPPMYYQQLMPYVPSRSVFCCPLDDGYNWPDPGYFTPVVPRFPSGCATVGTSYSYFLTAESVPIDVADFPSHLALFWDTSGAWHVGQPPAPADLTMEELYALEDPIYRVNVVFFDGHESSLSELRLADAEDDH